jgi:hypothetical protein
MACSRDLEKGKPDNTPMLLKYQPGNNGVTGRLEIIK